MEKVFENIKVEIYPDNKDSGFQWIGQIPKFWKSERLASILENVSERSRTDLPLLSITREKGVIIRDMDNEEENHNFIPDDLSNYKVLRKGQFGMNKMKAWQGSYGISEQDGIVSPAYFIFQLRNDIDSRFFHLAIRSRLYISFFGSASDGVRIGQWDLSKARMKNIPFLIPPVPEQTAITGFLDRKTALIDQAIDIKQKQIELLKERRQILIHKAVTRGLNPNVKMKDSGVEWIGEIPEGWKLKKLKYLGNAIIGLTYSPNDLCDMDKGTLVLRSSNLFEGKFKYGEKENAYVKSRIPDKLLIKENDILICSRNGSRDLIGKCALATKADSGHSFGAFTTVFRSDNNPYIFCILNSSIFKALSGMFLTSTINQLTIGNLNSIQVPIPPINEINEIRNYVESINLKVNKAITFKEQEIEKLKEYKATLINSAVTGKIKVSNDAK